MTLLVETKYVSGGKGHMPMCKLLFDSEISGHQRLLVYDSSDRPPIKTYKLLSSIYMNMFCYWQETESKTTGQAKCFWTKSKNRQLFIEVLDGSNLFKYLIVEPLKANEEEELKQENGLYVRFLLPGSWTLNMRRRNGFFSEIQVI